MAGDASGDCGGKRRFLDLDLIGNGREEPVGPVDAALDPDGEFGEFVVARRDCRETDILELRDVGLRRVVCSY